MSSHKQGTNGFTGTILDAILLGDSWDLSESDRVLKYAVHPDSLDSLGPENVNEFYGFEANAITFNLLFIENVCNIEFVFVESAVEADFLVSTIDDDFLVRSGIIPTLTLGFTTVFTFGLGDKPTVFLNTDGVGWSNSGLLQGGFSYSVIGHELLHLVGLAHPFEDQLGSTTFAGIDNVNDYGDLGQNQAVFTQMSNNDGYPSLIDITSFDFGHVFSPMALDIAALQFLYGSNDTFQNGDDTYYLEYDGTRKPLGWGCIWDTGGFDTISGEFSSVGVVIHLTAADLVGDDAGGHASYGNADEGGYTIANQVVIENAVGSVANDFLFGNSGSNVIAGLSGDDGIIGNGGSNILDGGEGTDVALYSGDRADYSIIKYNDGFTLVFNDAIPEEIDILTNIEVVLFDDESEDIGFSSHEPEKPSEIIKTTTELDVNYINFFLLSLGSIAESDASVSYRTLDGTAKAGLDYISTSGIATIVAGEDSVAIGIEIIGDRIQESEEFFSLEISNPVGGIFPVGIVTLTATHTIVDNDMFS